MSCYFSLQDVIKALESFFKVKDVSTMIAKDALFLHAMDQSYESMNVTASFDLKFNQVEFIRQGEFRKTTTYRSILGVESHYEIRIRGKRTIHQNPEEHLQFNEDYSCFRIQHRMFWIRPPNAMVIV